MDEAEEQWPEAVFDIVWRQRGPDQWVAEVKDTRTDQRRQVSSFQELERFIHSQLRLAGMQRPPSA
jgi:hypothetical protein